MEKGHKRSRGLTLLRTDGCIGIKRAVGGVMHPSCLMLTVSVTLCPKIRSHDYLNKPNHQVLAINRCIFCPDGLSIFQDDNVRIHQAQVVKHWFREQETSFSCPDWSPQSPDLNSTENLETLP